MKALNIGELLDELRAAKRELEGRAEGIGKAIAALEGDEARDRKVVKFKPAKRKPVKRVKVKRPKPKPAKPVPFVGTVVQVSGMAPEQRRALVLSLIGKNPMGLTMGELRALTSKLNDDERRNACQQLKVDGKIKREGNTWVLA